MKNIFTLLVLTLLLVPAQIFAAARDSVRRSSVLGDPHHRILAPSPDQRAREENTYADTMQEKLLEYSKQGSFGDVATLLDEKSAQRITCKDLKNIIKKIREHLKDLERKDPKEFGESKAYIIECICTIQRTIKKKKARIQDRKNKQIIATVAAEIIGYKSTNQSSDIKSAVADAGMSHYLIQKVGTTNIDHLYVLFKNHRDEFDNKSVLAAYELSKKMQREHGTPTIKKSSDYAIDNVVIILRDELLRREALPKECYCVIL